MADDRHTRKMQRKVAEILSALSGLDAQKLDPESSFLELGFESLSLTQVSLAIKRELGVDLGFRELLESYRTPSALAGHLAREVPPEEREVPPPERTAPAPASPPEPSEVPTRAVPDPTPLELPPMPEAEPPVGAAASASPAVARVILKQLRMMNHQLELLRGGPIDEGAEADRPDAAHAASAVRAEEPEKSEGERRPEDAADEERHGPWRPAARDPEGGLTDRQREHIRALVERMEERMPTSKRITQENRAHLADPRTAEGFRRAWKEAVMPVVSDRSEGAYIWDLDGNRYVDVAMGFGVALLGHHPPFVREALRKQLEEGFAIGPQTPLAGEVAALVRDLTGMERVAFCNTGSEAVLAAIRTARTVTGRTRIATFKGDYHGIFDEMLARGIELGGERRTMPIAPGIPPHMVEAVTVLDYGAEASLEAIREEAGELAAVLVEPVQSRHPDHQPAEFVRRLRKLTEEEGIPLILDEMITGFRSHPGGIQALWGVEADLVTYGKVAGGGMPIGIVTGKKRFLDALDGGHWRYGDDSIPEAGITWFAGTFVRHPLSLAAARATLAHLKEQGPALQEGLNRRTAEFVEELNRRFEEIGAPIHVETFSSLFLLKFLEGADAESLFYFHLKARGVHITEGRAAFLSQAHSAEDIEHLLDAFADSARALQEGGFLPRRRGEDTRAPAGRRVEAGRVAGTAASGGTTGAKPGDGPGPGPDWEETIVEVGGKRLRELPLTEGQKEIWLATRVSEDANRSFNLSNAVRLVGPLDEDAMREAVRRQVDRHEALRTTFEPEGSLVPDGPAQRIHPTFSVEIPLVDLSQLDPAERAERVEKLREQEVERPFDLENGPLFRASLIRLTPEEHLLFFTAHHIVCDGWSCGVLLRNIGDTYLALREGRPPELGEATQLGEYVRMEREIRRGPAGREAEEYWLDRLGEDPPVLELPTDRPRPSRKSYRAAREELSLGSGRWEEIRKAATSRGATPFALLYSVFEALLHRLTGQEDLVVGVSAAGQAMVGEKELVGDCVNTLPVRNRIEGETPFTEHLDATRTLLLDAFDHQQCTFGTLIEKLRLQRDPGRVPLVSVLFNLDPTLTALDYGELEVSARSNPRTCEIFDLFFNVVVGPDDFRLECTFNTDLLDRQTVVRWLGYYRNLLNAVVTDPDRPVGGLPLMDEEERGRILDEWSDADAGDRGAKLMALVEDREGSGEGAGAPPTSWKRIHLLDERLEPVPPGVPGTLYLGGFEAGPGDGAGAGGGADPSVGPEAEAKRIADPFRSEPGACLYRTEIRARWTRKGIVELLGGENGQAPTEETEEQIPRTATEKELADLWRELLVVGDFHVDEDFFQAGGHSLLAMRLLSRIEARFGVDIRLGTFFENSTIRTLAERIESVAPERNGHRKEATAAEERGRVPAAGQGSGDHDGHRDDRDGPANDRDGPGDDREGPGDGGEGHGDADLHEEGAPDDRQDRNEKRHDYEHPTPGKSTDESKGTDDRSDDELEEITL